MRLLNWFFGLGGRERIAGWRPVLTIPVGNAVACLDCRMISYPVHDECCVCGSRATYTIQRLLP